jgi:hypothetical protein
MINVLFHVLERGGKRIRKCRQCISRNCTCGYQLNCYVELLILKNYVKNECRRWIVVTEYCFVNELW